MLGKGKPSWLCIELTERLLCLIPTVHPGKGDDFCSGKGGNCWEGTSLLLSQNHCVYCDGSLEPITVLQSKDVTVPLTCLCCGAEDFLSPLPQQSQSSVIMHQPGLKQHIRCSWVCTATGWFVTAKGRTAKWGQKPVPSELYQATQGPVAGLWLRCWEDETCCLSFVSCFSMWDLRLLVLSLLPPQHVISRLHCINNEQ